MCLSISAGAKDAEINLFTYTSIILFEGWLITKSLHDMSVNNAHVRFNVWLLHAPPTRTTTKLSKHTNERLILIPFIFAGGKVTEYISGLALKKGRSFHPCQAKKYQIIRNYEPPALDGSILRIRASTRRLKTCAWLPQLSFFLATSAAVLPDELINNGSAPSAKSMTTSSWSAISAALCRAYVELKSERFGTFIPLKPCLVKNCSTVTFCAALSGNSCKSSEPPQESAALSGQTSSCRDTSGETNACSSSCGHCVTVRGLVSAPEQPALRRGSWHPMFSWGASSWESAARTASAGTQLGLVSAHSLFNWAKSTRMVAIFVSSAMQLPQFESQNMAGHRLNFRLEPRNRLQGGFLGHSACKALRLQGKKHTTKLLGCKSTCKVHCKCTLHISWCSSTHASRQTAIREATLWLWQNEETRTRSHEGTKTFFPVRIAFEKWMFLQEDYATRQHLDTFHKLEHQSKDQKGSGILRNTSAKHPVTAAVFPSRCT